MADIGVRGYGKNLSQAFEQAAIGLTAVICDPASVQPLQSTTIECRAPDHELLLVDWLNALVYEMSTRGMLFSRFHVLTKNTTLEGTAWGEVIDRPRHRPVVEVKGATYTELKVEHTVSGLWLAQCVIDV